jgi:hypothetical protein
MPVLERERASLKRVKPLSLCEFLAEHGGIRLNYNSRATMGSSDLLAMNAERWHKAKPFRKKLLRDDAGMNPDYAALTAWEAGYFNSPLRPEINELLDLIDTDLASGSVYSAADRDEIMRLAMLDEGAVEFDEPLETVDAPAGFPIPIHLRLIAPLTRYFPAYSEAREGDNGSVAYLYHFTTQRHQGSYVSPWLATVLPGATIRTKYWVRGFRHGETAPALLAAFDSAVERAWYADDFLHGPPF